MRGPDKAVLARARAWAFGPSLLLGTVGAAWYLALRPSFPGFAGERWPLALAFITGTALALAFLLAAQRLAHRSRSFAWASRRTTVAVARLRLSQGAAAVLAVATATLEELLFRGVLLSTVGLLPQALLFGLLHLPGRRGLAYALFAAVAGLAFGVAVLASGRIETAIAAHAWVNGVSLTRLARRRR